MGFNGDDWGGATAHMAVAWPNNEAVPAGINEDDAWGALTGFNLEAFNGADNERNFSREALDDDVLNQIVDDDEWMKITSDPDLDEQQLFDTNPEQVMPHLEDLQMTQDDLDMLSRMLDGPDRESEMPDVTEGCATETVPASIQTDVAEGCATETVPVSQEDVRDSTPH